MPAAAWMATTRDTATLLAEMRHALRVKFDQKHSALSPGNGNANANANAPANANTNTTSLVGAEWATVAKALFKEFDDDGNGFIGKMELRFGLHAIGMRCRPAEADEIMQVCVSVCL